MLRSYLMGSSLLCQLTGVLSLCVVHLSAQDVTQYPANPVIIESVRSGEYGTPAYLRFVPELIEDLGPEQLIRAYFQLQLQDQLIPGEEILYGKGITVEKFQRYHQGIPVEHSWFSVLLKDDDVLSIHAEHYTFRNLKVTPEFSEPEALTSALDQLGGELYAWQSTQGLLGVKSQMPVSLRSQLGKIARDEYPKGKLVIVRDFSGEQVTFDLAYRFEIECVIPFFKDIVYINAHDGHMMLRDPVIKHGTGETRYAGTRSFPTSNYNISGSDTFQLRGVDAVSGILCETRSINGMGGLPLSLAALYALSSPVLDGDQGDPCPSDGTWTAAETGDDLWEKAEHWRARFSMAPVPDVSCCIVYQPHPMLCNEIQNDDIALDAQWGAAVVAQYWHTRHGRSSYDNAGADIFSFVHYGDAYANAFWNGTYMTYGDGNAQKPQPDPVNGEFGPFTSLDICAHEIGHAVCTYTSNLVYQKESGALNESLSDIWAAAIEQFVLDSIDASLPYDPFGIGEQIDDRDNGLPPGDPAAQAIRWMDDPNAGANPDTYNGTYYYPTEGALCPAPVLATDYCGVHLNSGVINKWFYLLVAGSGQPLSPGSGFNGMKASQDDEINDLGNQYHVDGIGFEKAERITFLAETLLSPNASFADMRLASIQAARVLYGVCSDEEIQTTNAWYAVGVGNVFIPCTPRIVFSEFNPVTISEHSDETGCQSGSLVQLAVHSYMAIETIHLTTWGSATEYLDYELAENEISFNGNEIRILQVWIHDDRIVEDPDTLFIGFNEGGYTDTMFLVIQDDDVIPAFGGTLQLVSESFNEDMLPQGWQNLAVNVESGNDWQFNGTGSAEGKAYITFPGSSLPVYNLAAFSHNRLVSPMIDARGRSNVMISFDWAAGGEGDAIDPSVLFDYGSFQISYDGLVWIDIEDFVGSAGGAVIDSGTYVHSHPELDNRTFFLGFQWYNDALLGSEFSFTIDNVTVTSEDIGIASHVGDRMEARVPDHETIAFISENDGKLIGIIGDPEGDLGCTELRIAENDTINDITDSYCDRRSVKVFELLSANLTDSLDLTLFYKSGEVDDWATLSGLNILAVNGADVDDVGSGFTIIPANHVLVEENDGSVSFTFKTTATTRMYALTDRAPYPVIRWVQNSSDHDTLSLRERIGIACPMDTIRFDPQLANVVIPLTGSEILLDKDIIILGDGVNTTTIAGSALARVFHIISGAHVVLRDLTLCCGVAEGFGDIILNEGSLRVKDVRFQED